MGMYASLFALPEPLLEEMRVDPAVRGEWLGDPGELDAHDLGKLWHGLHYLLCGSPDATDAPLGRAVIGGTPLAADHDMGYGPALALSAREVGQIAAAMRALAPEDVAARFDPAAMARDAIYPTAIWERDAELVLEELVAAYVSLRNYYERAAKAGLAMLSWVA